MFSASKFLRIWFIFFLGCFPTSFSATEQSHFIVYVFFFLFLFSFHFDTWIVNPPTTFDVVSRIPSSFLGSRSLKHGRSPLSDVSMHEKTWKRYSSRWFWCSCLLNLLGNLFFNTWSSWFYFLFYSYGCREWSFVRYIWTSIGPVWWPVDAFASISLAKVTRRNVSWMMAFSVFIISITGVIWLIASIYVSTINFKLILVWCWWFLVQRFTELLMVTCNCWRILWMWVFHVFSLKPESLIC